jgi:zinc/manganese transport system substrate-binding protein
VKARYPFPVVAMVLAAVVGVTLTACGPLGSTPQVGRIPAVGAENEYANVIAQVGGRYVAVTSILSNPNLDPHVYEANTVNAARIAGARLIVQNGLGYDTFMNTLENAAPVRGRIVLTVSRVLGYPPDTPNPHLWYRPGTMARVAEAVARALERLAPDHRQYFVRRLGRFEASLGAWSRALERLRRHYAGMPVAVTEPVADYLLQAAGLTIKTPWAFQAAVMNGTDPSPEDVAIETSLLVHRRVRVLVYNRQAVDPITENLLGVARAHHVPVIGVYETLPRGYSYQQWMVAETNALYRALSQGRSEVTLP